MAKKKTAKRKNLRLAYESSGVKSSYSSWVRTKVIPIIGSKALQALPSRKGSKESEWSVTERNMNRVTKSLGISVLPRPPKRKKKKEAAVKILDKLGTDLTAELLLKLIEYIPKPVSLKDEVVYRIPVHGFSNNYQYKDIGGNGRKVCTPAYNKWKTLGDAAMSHLVSPVDYDTIDFDKPVHLDLHFKHIPAMDTTNLIKSAQDLIFRALDRDDKVVKSCNITSEDSVGYKDGYIVAKMRNL